LDTSTIRVTEIGAVLWEVEHKKILGANDIMLYEPDYEAHFNAETVAMMERVCGLTPDMLREFGQPPAPAFQALEDYCVKHKVDYIVAHNGENYDRPLLYAELTRHGVKGDKLRGLPWIDTRTDIPFANEPDSRKLKHLACDLGIINHFPHRALTDVLTMMLVLSHYPINDVIAYSKIPFITVRAMVQYEQRELAKAQRFAWQQIGDGPVYPKCWIKRIKENALDAERAKCKAGGFEIITL
jgi:DNA polymerase-3 subunit epsilon